MREIVKLFLFWVLLSAPAAAQPAPFRDPLVDRLAGRWVMTGTIEGKAVTHDVNGQWVLGHQYMLLRQTSRERRAGSASPAYEAHWYIGWNEVEKRYGVVLLDVSGEVSMPVLGAGTPQINALPFVFANRDGSVTRTTLTHDRRANRWTWQILIDRAGQVTTFADLVMTRAPAAAAPEGGTAASQPGTPAMTGRN